MTLFGVGAVFYLPGLLGLPFGLAVPLVAVSAIIVALALGKLLEKRFPEEFQRRP